MEINIRTNEKIVNVSKTLSGMLTTAAEMSMALTSAKDINLCDINIEGSIFHVTLGATLYKRSINHYMAVEAEEIFKKYIPTHCSVNVIMKEWSLINLKNRWAGKH